MIPKTLYSAHRIDLGVALSPKNVHKRIFFSGRQRQAWTAHSDRKSRWIVSASWGRGGGWYLYLINAAISQCTDRIILCLELTSRESSSDKELIRGGKGEYDFGDLSVIGHMKDTGREQKPMLPSFISH